MNLGQSLRALAATTFNFLFQFSGRKKNFLPHRKWDILTFGIGISSLTRLGSQQAGFCLGQGQLKFRRKISRRGTLGIPGKMLLGRDPGEIFYRGGILGKELSGKESQEGGFHFLERIYGSTPYLLAVVASVVTREESRGEIM
jgi:hypothetical protein